MNIHEYQAKELLQKFGVATTRGKVASTPDEAETIAREIVDGSSSGGPLLQPSDAAPPKDAEKRGGSAASAVEIVVKAQVHAGGRGKGTFTNGFKGGVHIVKSPKEARDVAEKMLGQVLVTHQTGAAGRVVHKVLVGESAEIAREIYFAILLDRAIAAPLIV